MSNSKQVLITGGAGYIGSHTAVALAQAGYIPVILDNYSNSNPEVILRIEEILGHSVKNYRGDCTDPDLLRSICNKEKFDGVIHFAASKAVGESVELPLKYYHNNLNSLLSLLMVMEEFQVPHLVFSSSCTIYGQPDTLPVTEKTLPKAAASPYGNTKKICEDIIEDVVSSPANLKAISLRYFNPIGAHPSAKIGELPLGAPNNLVPFITQTAAGLRKKLTIFGQDYLTPDGTCIRDYIHVIDLSEAHVRALQFLEDQPHQSYYEVFNLGTGAGTSVMEMVNAFQKVAGVDLNYDFGPRRSGDVEQIYASVDKASKMLKWRASRGLEQALKDAWKWQQTLMKTV